MKILVVDDEQAVRESLRRSLRFNGYEVLTANDGLEAVETVRAENPELLILDIMMPNMDGLEVCRTLRSEGWDRPILVLTARDGVSDRVSGLDAGADDYLPKPFALEELLARVRSLVRRASADSIAAEAPVESKLSFEDLELDADTREVSRGGRAISLTRTEFALLQLLMENPARFFLAARSWKRYGVTISLPPAMPSRSISATCVRRPRVRAILASSTLSVAWAMF